MSKNIEQKLREAIAKSKMSRYKISQLSGVSEAQLSLFVNKKRTLTLPAAAKVAEVLGLELKPKKQK
jgi:plasmid maintenance system antidote protein VapI